MPPQLSAPPLPLPQPPSPDSPPPSSSSSSSSSSSTSAAAAALSTRNASAIVVDALYNNIVPLSLLALTGATVIGGWLSLSYHVFGRRKKRSHKLFQEDIPQAVSKDPSENESAGDPKMSNQIYFRKPEVVKYFTRIRFIAEKVPKDNEVIVIGGGIGGMTSGTLLGILGGASHTFVTSRSNLVMNDVGDFVDSVTPKTAGTMSPSSQMAGSPSSSSFQMLVASSPSLTPNRTSRASVSNISFASTSNPGTPHSGPQSVSGRSGRQPSLSSRHTASSNEFDTGAHYVSSACADPDQFAGQLFKLVTQDNIALDPITRDMIFIEDDPDPLHNSADGSGNNNDSHDNIGSGEVPEHPSELVQRPGKFYAMPIGLPAFRSFLLSVLLERAEGLTSDVEKIVRDRIDVLLSTMRIANRSLYAYYARQLLVPKRFKGWLDRFFPPLCSQLGKLQLEDTIHGILFHGQTYAEVLAHTKNYKSDSASTPAFNANVLLQLSRIKLLLLSMVVEYGADPRDSSFLAHSFVLLSYINGKSYIRGSPQVFSAACACLIKDAGGHSVVNATIDKLMLSDFVPPAAAAAAATDSASSSTTATASSLGYRAKGVIVKKSISFKAEPVSLQGRHVVSAVGVQNLCLNMLDTTDHLRHEFEAIDGDKLSGGSSIYVFISFKGDADDADLPYENVIYVKNQSLSAAFAQFCENRRVAPPPVVKITFPCRKDKEWKTRHPGLSNCILITYAKYEWFQNWALNNSGMRGAKYEEYKSDLASTMMGIFFGMFPSLKKRILWWNVATPLTEAHYFMSNRGSPYGATCTPARFAPSAQHWFGTAETDVSNLFLAGQDTFMPTMFGAMMGGLLAACSVLGDRWFYPLHFIITNMIDHYEETRTMSRPFALLCTFRSLYNTFFNYSL